MAQSDEFYRNLCSSETLRSGRKGFFRDFSEYVIDTAGDAWISEVFGRLTDDEERVRTVFANDVIKDAVKGTLSNVKPLYRDKDATVAINKRMEALQMVSERKWEKALLLFSQSILRAPSTRDGYRDLTMPSALSSRAEIFMRLGEYDLALEDLRLAVESPASSDIRSQLKKKQKECERLIEESQTSLVPVSSHGNLRINNRKCNPPPLSGGPHPQHPCASTLLEICETGNAGKAAIAAKEIRTGDCLVVEEPLAACLLPEFYGTHCHHCFSRLRAPVGCPDCSSVAFCNRACRDIALSTYHKYECKILALLIGSGMSVLSMVALRMVTQEGLKKCLKIYDILKRREITSKDDSKKKEENSEVTTKLSKSAKRNLRRKKIKELHLNCNKKNDTNAQTNGVATNNDKKEKKSEEETIDIQAYELVNHSSMRSPQDFLERTLMAAFLLRCLQRVNFFEKTSGDKEIPNEAELAIGSLLLKNLQLLQFNAHEFFETCTTAKHRFRGSKPVYLGVAIYTIVARFNHDCYPAVSRYFVGRNIVIRATRSLRKGDVIAENYGPIFTKRSLEERQRTLAGRYWFRCTCRACQEDWPPFEKLTNDSVRLRCPTRGCEKLFSRTVSSKITKCSSCQMKINLNERLASLQQCEALYAEGMEKKMDEEKVEEAIEIFVQALEKFHQIAVPPHRDTHLAEIALGACMASSGNCSTLT